mgnify:CR=1 FL=1
MANTVITLEDLLEFENRMKQFIDRRLQEVEQEPKQAFYSPAEVAKMVGLTVHAVRHRLRNPNEPYLKGVQKDGIGCTWLIPKESLDAFVQNLKPKNR